MYQGGRAGDEAKQRKSPAKSGRVGITGLIWRLTKWLTYQLLTELLNKYTY